MIKIIRILNNNKYITSRQLIQCIGLLPDEYKDLDIKIIILSHKLEFLKYIYTDKLWIKLYNLFTNKLNGTSCDRSNKVFVCAFNFKIQDNFEYNGLQRLKLIETLYHEIKHQHQRQTMQEHYKETVLNKDYLKRVAYEDRWEEFDARKFASKMMNENYKVLSEILIKEK